MAQYTDGVSQKNKMGGRKMSYSTIDEAVKQLKAGGLIIISDDERRENEGDLLGIGSQMTPQNVNFMITQARGLLCTPISAEIADKLALKPMVEHNTEINATAFTISLDGSHEATGVTTGISAFDRSATIMQLAKSDAKASDFVHPGHSFPLVAAAGGTLERQGHTEAAVDLAKLAGEPAVGAICEIVLPDGHMARQDYLAEMAEKFHLPFITIQELVAYLKDKASSKSLA
ncbi:3,4-dihydroxy-2-butanone-4-phosphate synthase [Oenococcus kitaharae]|uniref:3,4-dihydroxy-2-butanone 4-phosphate synthase n=1 Tax=Oenococcus kitaharae DSM 17330 TaxID=1045004 RepID=G9WF50_9LACO|nr:3,4-dihydroxy-2-butanone-4-phosphate synthase [Oenococcus kitaharae]EHN58770.1 34-dihydroxy-2-butanone 4-phosphate synthase / GTP cyclohydrolase II [Oenococcus kitaharae DSM 17330]